MTGATSTAGLSASCDTANTTWISNTTPTNWTVHDAAPAAGQGGYAVGTSQVLKSLNADGTTYKYAQFGLTAGNMGIVGWENWNNTASTTTAFYPGSSVAAHAGFNFTSANGTQFSSAYPVVLTYSVPQSIYIFTTPRYIVLAPSPAQAANYGMALLEFSRDTNSTDITYPCVATMNFSTSMYSAVASAFGITRFKKPIAVGDYGQSTGTNLGVSSHTYGSAYNIQGLGSVGAATQQTTTLGTGEVPYTLALPVIIGGAQTGYYAVVLGKVQGGILQVPNAAPAAVQLDEMTVGGSQYIVIKNTSGLFLVPKA